MSALAADVPAVDMGDHRAEFKTQNTIGASNCVCHFLTSGWDVCRLCSLWWQVNSSLVLERGTIWVRLSFPLTTKLAKGTVKHRVLELEACLVAF